MPFCHCNFKMIKIRTSLLTFTWWMNLHVCTFIKTRRSTRVNFLQVTRFAGYCRLITTIFSPTHKDLSQGRQIEVVYLNFFVNNNEVQYVQYVVLLCIWVLIISQVRHPFFLTLIMKIGKDIWHGICHWELKGSDLLLSIKHSYVCHQHHRIRRAIV